MSGLEDVAFPVQTGLMDGLRERLMANGADIEESGNMLETLDP